MDIHVLESKIFLLYDPTLMECLLKIHESNFFIYMISIEKLLSEMEVSIAATDG